MEENEKIIEVLMERITENLDVFNDDEKSELNANSQLYRKVYLLGWFDNRF